jgi:uroporphyrin-3 C-methyltransferase
MSEGIPSQADNSAHADPAQPVRASPDRSREPAESGGPRSFGVHPGLLLAAALLALAIVGWQWYDNRTQTTVLKEELARRLADAESRNKEVVALARESAERVRELVGRIESLEGGLAESQNHQVALEAMYQQLSRSSDEWALAEIEQTLTIAAQQLQLAGNVKAALLALQNADARLQRLDRPQLAALRKVIDRDIERLRVAPHVDVAGIAVKIDGVVSAVDGLALVMQQRPPPQALQPALEGDDAGMFRRLAREFWQDLRSLVRIQTIERPEVPLIDPTQAFFLRENLKLRLLSARVALLQRDERTYRSDLQAARAWLERFYDTRDRNQAAVLATVRSLADVPIGIDTSDINASLKAVRDYKLTREKAAR